MAGELEQLSFFTDASSVIEEPTEVTIPEPTLIGTGDGGRILPSDASAYTKQVLEILAAEMQQGKSQHLLDYLQECSRFYRYSTQNQLLIRIQAPDARFVQSFDKWSKDGYKIREGARAIRVWAPTKYKKKEKQKKEDGSGEEEEVVIEKTGYILVPTHPDTNIENLDEKPLPEFFTPLGNNHDELAVKLVEAMRADGITVKDAPLNSAEGVSRGGTVLLREGRDSTNRCLTAIHEWTHELLHQSRPDRGAGLGERVRECHAEAAAYVIANHFGVPSPFSSDYILQWGNTSELLLAEFEWVNKAVKHILDTLEAPYLPTPEEQTPKQVTQKKRSKPHTKRKKA